MKRIYLLLSLFFISIITYAQPSWSKKAIKSVFLLKTFAPDGTLLGDANGFFVNEKGDAISSFQPFKGAQRAVVIDATGKEYEVTHILGANETYDVAKFSVDIKKAVALPIAPNVQTEHTSVWLLPYRDMKLMTRGDVTKAELFNGDYAYYTLDMAMPENSLSAPLLNEAGEVVGLMQSSAGSSTTSYAVSARFADSLRMTGLSINDPVLRSTYIKKALPADVGQALLTLYVAASTLDSLSYAALVDDFIRQFPTEQDGYIYKAQLAAGGDKYEEADRYIAQALKTATRPEEVHFTYSRLMYQKALYKPQVTYDAWNFDQALQEVDKAYEINPQPGYLQHKAYILFAKKEYVKASNIYEQLFQSSLRSPEIFYEASRCKVMQGDTIGQIALLDSAVATFSRPYLKEASTYLLARAQACLDAGKYRAAVTDLNEYEELMKTQVNDNFYYLRYQAELGGRLFQQALNDITRATEINPTQEIYYAEKASLEVRVGYFDEAIQSAQQCIAVAPDFSDGYLFLGLAQCLKDQKTEGVKNLQKAKELGDTQADELIEKYSK